MGLVWARASWVPWVQFLSLSYCTEYSNVKFYLIYKPSLSQDGVILGADTRATEGPIVADKNCEKIHYMAPNIYCCGAGTAADTEAVTGICYNANVFLAVYYYFMPCGYFYMEGLEDFLSYLNKQEAIEHENCFLYCRHG